MSVHSSGAGTTWNESLDVDQPHGLDYREFQDFRIGVRKRLGQEHLEFTDNTVGGDHIPGGAAIMDIVDGSADVTDGWNDGTYRGGGLWYSLCGQLWCATLDGTYDGVVDATILKLHPDLQWAGGDVTWAGAHEFDQSVDFTGPIEVDQSAEFLGTICCAADVLFDASVTVSADGTLSVIGDMSVGGVARFASTTDLSGAVYGRQVAFAWACFSAGADGGAGGTDNVFDSYNVSDVSRTAAGVYRIYFTTNAANAYYAAHGTGLFADNTRGYIQCFSMDVSGVGMGVKDSGGNYQDPTRLSVTVFGGW